MELKNVHLVSFGSLVSAESGERSVKQRMQKWPGAYFAGFAGCSQTPLSPKKKKKKGRCVSTVASPADAAKPCAESTSRFRITFHVVRSSQSLPLGRGTGAWNWGVVPRYPPCPHKRFRRVSWQTGQFTANLVSLCS